MKHFHWLLVLAALPLVGQLPVQAPSPCIQQACFFATVSGTVAASGTSALTIQQPATAPRQVTFLAAVVQCSGQAFSIDQSQNGTAATTTAGTAVALLPLQTITTAAAKVFTASNAGAGTAVAPTLIYTAGDPKVIDLAQRTMGVAGTATNYTVKITNTGSGNCTGSVSIYWAEKI